MVTAEKTLTDAHKRFKAIFYNSGAAMNQETTDEEEAAAFVNRNKGQQMLQKSLDEVRGLITKNADNEALAAQVALIFIGI